MVEIRPRVSGYIDSIHFQDGAEVKAGDLLFVIDPRPYQAELEQAQARRQQAETHLELAQNDFKRAESLQGHQGDFRRGIRQPQQSRPRSRSRAGRRQGQRSHRPPQPGLHPDQGPGQRQDRAPAGDGRQFRPASGQRRLGHRAGHPGFAGPHLLLLRRGGSALPQLPEQREGRRRPMAARSRASWRWSVRQGFPHRGRLDFFDNQVNPQTGTIRLRAVFENADRSAGAGHVRQRARPGRAAGAGAAGPRRRRPVGPGL